MSTHPRTAGPTGDGPALPRGLPAILEPWASIFAAMPEDHVLIIGRLIASVLPLIEIEENALRDGLAELDAFDDIAAAGPLERLMISELMWLKVMPGEFTRRIAEGEALRRRPVYRDRADDRAVMVLVDNGPRMLGRRRLVALAALLALAASAHRRGDRFLWSATGHVGAAWQDGLTRRGLSRFINQTHGREIDEQSVEVLLKEAPTGPGDERAIVWMITAGAAVIGMYRPDHHLEIDEVWPQFDAVEPDHSPDYQAEVRVTSRPGRQRRARFRFPDEQSCADTLRAPFRAKSAARLHRGASGWAPHWVSQEADDGGAVFRDGDSLMLYRRHATPLRVELSAGDQLLGVRCPGNGPSVVVWRRGFELQAARFNAQVGVFEDGATVLGDDHPAMSDQHPEAAVPPLLRLGRKAAFVFGAPNGQVFELDFAGDVATGAISIRPADQVSDLRLLSRARSWLLFEGERGGQSVLLLVNTRTGRRVFLRVSGFLDSPFAFRGSALVGETGGALVANDDGWHWLSPTWWSEDMALPAPPVPRDAVLLRLDPLQHAKNAHVANDPDAASFAGRSWNAWFWSQDNGLQECLFRSGSWQQYARPAPNFDGQVLAMVLIGKEVFARVRAESGEEQIVQFRLGAALASRTELIGRFWGEEEVCVEL